MDYLEKGRDTGRALLPDPDRKAGDRPAGFILGVSISRGCEETNRLRPCRRKQLIFQLRLEEEAAYKAKVKESFLKNSQKHIGRLFGSKWTTKRLEDLVEPNAAIRYGILKVGTYCDHGVPTVAIKNLNVNFEEDLHKTDPSIEVRYRERVEILQSVPGIGMISVMEVLELQDISRFRRAEQLAAYVGLTLSQYSSADKVRMGRITGIGKNTLRSLLVEDSYTLIRKDQAMREKDERIKIRSGGKRAIVAIARTLLLAHEKILLDGQVYAFQLAA